VKVLNVAGPRASEEPGVGEFVIRSLEEAFGKLAQSDHRCSRPLSSSSSPSNAAPGALERWRCGMLPETTEERSIPRR
jgi:hypothetical protein